MPRVLGIKSPQHHQLGEPQRIRVPKNERTKPELRAAALANPDLSDPEGPSISQADTGGAARKL